MKGEFTAETQKPLRLSRTRRYAVPAALLLVIVTIVLTPLRTVFSQIGVGKPPRISDSGIEGEVSIGPMCPVVRSDQPCPDKPFEASIEIRNQDDQGGHLTVHSGKDGRFRVKLAPGKYKLTSISPNPGAPPHAPPPQSATVESGKYAHVTIMYDSGIR
jgi:hypothetical protein